MRNRTLIALLAGTAAIAAAPLAWTQSTDPTLGAGTSTSGSTTTEDRTTGTTGTATGTADGSMNSATSSGTTGSQTDTTTETTTGSQTGTTTGSQTGSQPGTTTETTTGTSGATTPGYSSGSTTGSTTGSSSSVSGTAKLQGTDATFLQKAMEGGREEVQNAQVAMRNAQRAEVRNAASMMLEDHTRTNQKLEQLASTKGWDMPAASDMAESDQSRLGTGAAFDDNYLEQEIRHHREAISLYRAQAASGSDPELRQFAKETLPGLEHHLEMLQGSISAK